MATLSELITEADVSSVDKSRVHEIYEQWPEHFRQAAKIKVGLDHGPEFYKTVVLCGMGGSGTSCDILNDLLNSHGRVPSMVFKGDTMPAWVNKHSLAIVNSVSGNTREAVSMMQAASKTNAEVVCISSGGKLKEFAEKHGHRHIAIPNFSLPRASLPYLVIPGLRLVDSFLVKSLKKEIAAMPETLARTARSISLKVPQKSNASKKIAYFLSEGFAFCFASPSLLSVATRFKNSLNENAKIHCLKESLLEASHNEIVPFTYDNNVQAKAMLLRWSSDSEIVKERFAKVHRLFVEIDKPVMEITAGEEDLLSAIISSIYKLDYATIYMAIIRKVDPSPTPAIDILKSI